MKSFPEDQVAELKHLCPDVSHFEEGGCAYLLLPGLGLPEGCIPGAQMHFSVQPPVTVTPPGCFFAEKVKFRTDRNWNVTGVRIGERNWHAFSWKAHPNLRLLRW